MVYKKFKKESMQRRLVRNRQSAKESRERTKATLAMTGTISVENARLRAENERLRLLLAALNQQCHNLHVMVTKCAERFCAIEEDARLLDERMSVVCGGDSAQDHFALYGNG